jgi:hypothetical protein
VESQDVALTPRRPSGTVLRGHVGQLRLRRDQYADTLAASLEAILAPLPQPERVVLLRELAASWRLSPTRSGLSLPYATPADAAAAEAALRRELARRVLPLLCARHS